MPAFNRCPSCKQRLYPWWKGIFRGYTPVRCTACGKLLVKADAWLAGTMMIALAVQAYFFVDDALGGKTRVFPGFVGATCAAILFVALRIVKESEQRADLQRWWKWLPRLSLLTLFLLLTFICADLALYYQRRSWVKQRTIAGHRGAVTTVDFAPDGKHIVTTGADGDVRWWSADGSEGVVVRNVGSLELVSAAVAPDGNRVAIVEQGSGGPFASRIMIWDRNHMPPVVPVLTSSFQIDAVRFSSDGRRLMTLGTEGWALWDAITGKQLEKVELGPLVVRFAVVG